MFPYEVRDVLVSIKDVCLSIDGHKILEGVTAEVRDIVRPGCTQGQVVGILGPSGVGKTQLSRVMAGLQAPTSGSVTVEGGKPVRAGLVGFVAQNYPLLRHRTVLGNLLVAASMSGCGPREAALKAGMYLEEFALSDKADEWPSRLSGGQRQRVAIARQLLCSDHFMIMDEPFTGLDPLMKEKTCDLIRQVSSSHESTTIFVIAHDVPAVASIADRLWLIGRPRAGDGTFLPGSSIRREIDLAAMGLAWDPDARRRPEFFNLIREVSDLFHSL